MDQPFIKNLKRIARKIERLPERARERIIERRARRSWKSPAEIAEYRKSIKIYDVIPFFNELDLLEIRLDFLGPHVDHFVICEAVETFSGNPKPLRFKEHEKRYARWAHKIIYHTTDAIPSDAADLKRRLDTASYKSDEERRVIEYALSTDIIDPSKVYWVKEFYIKESIRTALVDLKDTDFCYLSDLDEFWNPELLIDYSADDVFRLRQLPYMYYLNNRSDEDWRGWSGTVAARYGTIKQHSLNHIRTHKNKVPFIPLHNGGWHFTFQGGAKGAERKIVDSAHPFYKPEETLPGLAEKIAANVDYKGRNIKLWVDESDLPRYLVENKEKYKAFFR